MEQDGQPPPPPVAALFLVVFDQKIGYVLQWQRTSSPDVKIDGVEFKSLPSGLHSVRDDLVYFVHRQFAGISAFVQAPADSTSRNATFVAVGALLPLTQGRLGKAWLHARELRLAAKELIKNPLDTRPLELFWKQYGSADVDAAPQSMPSSPLSFRRESLATSFKRGRNMSGSVGSLAPSHFLASDHPANSMSDMLDLFGPLIFPLVRSALLRKRILLLGSAPVQNACHYVYGLSILSGVPSSLDEILPPAAERPSPVQPLFNVGVCDMPDLLSNTSDSSWLACTTDDILGDKNQIYDILVRLPPPSKTHYPSSLRPYPTLHTSDGKPIKATQRDLRRYRLLRTDLKRMDLARRRYRDNDSNDNDRDDDDDYDDDMSPLIRRITTPLNDLDPSLLRTDETTAVEPLTWSAMAYKGFLWWASAGQQDAWEGEETSLDRSLLSDLPLIRDAFPQPPSARWTAAIEAQETATVLTAYFQRNTALVLQTLAEVVEEADDDTEEGIEEEEILVRGDDVRRMGLDVWSEGDRGFVREAMEVYFGREARVEEEGVRVCGVRVC